MSTNNPCRKRASTFKAPAVLAAISMLGLLAALLGDGVFDVVAWLAAGTPAAVIAWAMSARRE
jgi:xanthosine utilization system XapX-like protein